MLLRRGAVKRTGHPPVTVDLRFCGRMPTISTSSPVRTMPCSTRPVTTVPRPCAQVKRGRAVQEGLWRPAAGGVRPPRSPQRRREARRLRGQAAHSCGACLCRPRTPPGRLPHRIPHSTSPCTTPHTPCLTPRNPRPAPRVNTLAGSLVLAWCCRSDSLPLPHPRACLDGEDILHGHGKGLVQRAHGVGDVAVHLLHQLQDGIPAGGRGWGGCVVRVCECVCVIWRREQEGGGGEGGQSRCGCVRACVCVRVWVWVCAWGWGWGRADAQTVQSRADREQAGWLRQGVAQDRHAG